MGEPFINGSIYHCFFYQLFQFIKFYTKSNLYTFFAFLLILVDPTLSAQFVIVNPEIIQLFYSF